MLGLFGKKAAGPRGAKGYRAYVVGDVHGRLDLLNQLLGQIEDDLSGRPPRETILVFLGDLIDRGPDSAGVIERLRNYQRPGVRTVFLAGNHEEVLLRVLHRACEVAVEAQYEVHDATGLFLARADLRVVGTRRLPELDGAVHRDAAQHRKDLPTPHRDVDAPQDRTPAELDRAVDDLHHRFVHVQSSAFRNAARFCRIRDR